MAAATTPVPAAPTADEAEAAAAAAALPPLTDDQCARVAALLASVRAPDAAA